MFILLPKYFKKQQKPPVWLEWVQAGISQVKNRAAAGVVSMSSHVWTLTCSSLHAALDSSMS